MGLARLLDDDSIPEHYSGIHEYPAYPGIGWRSCILPLYEVITGRKPGDKFMERAEYVGFGILLLLLVVANLNDVLRFFGLM